MIIGDRVNRIEAFVKDRTTFEGMKINVVVKDVREENNRLEIDYVYEVDYGAHGNLKIEGTLFAEEEKDLKEKILEEWGKNKKLDENFAERFFNTVNFLGSAHGTIIARVLNMRPPLIPPRIVKKK